MQRNLHNLRNAKPWIHMKSDRIKHSPRIVSWYLNCFRHLKNQLRTEFDLTLQGLKLERQLHRAIRSLRRGEATLVRSNFPLISFALIQGWEALIIKYETRRQINSSWSRDETSKPQPPPTVPSAGSRAERAEVTVGRTLLIVSQPRRCRDGERVETWTRSVANCRTPALRASQSPPLPRLSWQRHLGRPSWLVFDEFRREQREGPAQMALTNWQRVGGGLAALGLPVWLCVRACVRASDTDSEKPHLRMPAQRASPEFRHCGLPEPPASLASAQADVLVEFFMSILAGKCWSFCWYRWSFKWFILSKDSRLRLSFSYILKSARRHLHFVPTWQFETIIPGCKKHSDVAFFVLKTSCSTSKSDMIWPPMF